MERLFDKVLVTGGAGYCGARLVPQMLARGYKVTVYDIMFFGNQFLPRDNPNLRIIDGDIRDTAKFAAAVAGHDAVVNLACISNDASFELDEDLSTSINLNAFEPLVLAAKKAGVKRFVYAIMTPRIPGSLPARSSSSSASSGCCIGNIASPTKRLGYFRCAAEQASL